MKEMNDMAEIKFDITEEQVQEAVRAIVREELADMADYEDCYGIKGMLKAEVGKVVRDLVAKETAGRFDEIARQAVEEHVSEPFELDSGWGYERKQFESYGDFIRYKLHEKFDKDTWSVRREFEKRVQAKVDKAWNEYRDDAIAVATAKLEAVKAVD